MLLNNNCAFIVSRLKDFSERFTTIGTPAQENRTAKYFSFLSRLKDSQEIYYYSLFIPRFGTEYNTDCV